MSYKQLMHFCSVCWLTTEHIYNTINLHNYCISGHYLSSCFLFKIIFLRPDSVSMSNRALPSLYQFGLNECVVIWRWRKNPVSKMLCVKQKKETMDNVQKHTNCINISSSQTLRSCHQPSWTLTLYLSRFVFCLLWLLIAVKPPRPRFSEWNT
jgi:hypothetical protein